MQSASTGDQPINTRPSGQSNDCRQQTSRTMAAAISNARMPMRLNHCDPILFSRDRHLSVLRTYRRKHRRAGCGGAGIVPQLRARCPNSWRKTSRLHRRTEGPAPGAVGVFQHHAAPPQRLLNPEHALRSSTTSFSTLPAKFRVHCRHSTARQALFQQEACNALTDKVSSKMTQGRWGQYLIRRSPTAACPFRESRRIHASEFGGAGHSCP